MKKNSTFKIGDWFSEIFLITHKDAKISRPRVKPVELFDEDMRVELLSKKRRLITKALNRKLLF